MAAEKFVLLEIDFPRMKEIPDEVKAAREALSDKYSIEAFPTLYFTDAKGRPFAEAPMEMEPAAWKEVLTAAAADGDAVKANLAAAEKAKGVDKAKALFEVYEKLPPGVADSFYPDLGKTILANDADDVTGYAKMLEEAKAEEAFGRKVDELATEGKWDELLAFIDAFITKQKFEGEKKQNLLMLKANVYYEKGDMKAVIAQLEAAAAIDPKSDIGQGITNEILPGLKAELAEAEAEEGKAKKEAEPKKAAE